MYIYMSNTFIYNNVCSISCSFPSASLVPHPPLVPPSSQNPFLVCTRVHVCIISFPQKENSKELKPLLQKKRIGSPKLTP